MRILSDLAGMISLPTTRFGPIQDAQQNPTVQGQTRSHEQYPDSDAAHRRPQPVPQNESAHDRNQDHQNGGVRETETGSESDHQTRDSQQQEESDDRSRTFEANINWAIPLSLPRNPINHDMTGLNERPTLAEQFIHTRNQRTTFRAFSANLDNSEETENLATGSAIHAYISMREFFSLIGPGPRGIYGDAVYSQEGLDRVITQLMAAESRNQGIRPTAEAALAKLERQKADDAFIESHKKSLECTICLDQTKLGDDVIFMPSPHARRPSSTSFSRLDGSNALREENANDAAETAANTDTRSTTPSVDSDGNTMMRRLFFPLFGSSTGAGAGDAPDRPQAQAESNGEGSAASVAASSENSENSERASNRRNMEDSLRAIMRSFEIQMPQIPPFSTSDELNRDASGEQRAAPLRHILRPTALNNNDSREATSSRTEENQDRSETERQQQAHMHTFTTQVPLLHLPPQAAIGMIGHILSGATDDMTAAGFGTHVFVLPRPRRQTSEDALNTSRDHQPGAPDEPGTSGASGATESNINERGQNDPQWTTALRMEADETRQRDRERQRELRRRLDGEVDQERTGSRRQATTNRATGLASAYLPVEVETAGAAELG
ncbi:putative RING finger protein P32A8.03c [Ceratocystis lukuohia]|uniref:RING finger protein P32A8.03c n=1 Tax=Ceratocystis lukuohia TaxID=2019550 RepID=A0ABR4MRB9_9PEZI